MKKWLIRKVMWFLIKNYIGKLWNHIVNKKLSLWTHFEIKFTDKCKKKWQTNRGQLWNPEQGFFACFLLLVLSSKITLNRAISSSSDYYYHHFYSYHESSFLSHIYIKVNSYLHQLKNLNATEACLDSRQLRAQNQQKKQAQSQQYRHQSDIPLCCHDRQRRTYFTPRCSLQISTLSRQIPT